MKIRVIFVDDEPNIIQGLQRMLRNMRDEWEMEFAGSGEEALKILSQKQFDVVVTDMRMPGVDGANLLNQVMKLYPNTVRIILSGHSDREMIMRSVKSSHQFLAKPCDPQTLKRTVNHACQIRELLTTESLLKLVGGIGELPCSPDLYNQISAEMQNPNTSLKHIGNLIAQDVVMTAEILKLVNSAFFGMPQRVNSPQQAVSLLGLDILKGLILYVNLFSSSKVDPRLGFSMQDFSQHSILVSNLATKIARKEHCEPKVVEDVLLAGLLHDIGKIVLCKSPEEYLKVKKYCAKMKCDFQEAEYQVLGTSHAEVGAYLLALWGTPGKIVAAVVYHHDRKIFYEELSSANSMVQIANRLVNTGGDCEILLKQMDVPELYRGEVLTRLPSWVESYQTLKEQLN